jgi:division protein CdvB (Snf7/Vps24/ESCRT-III family)
LLKSRRQRRLARWCAIAISYLTAKGAVKIMAKDLVRTRQYITKFYEMKCQMQAVGLRLQVEGLRALLMLQTMKSTAAMVDAMKGVTKAMMQMNRSVNLPQMQRIMQEFEKQSEVMEMKQELMNDTMDDVMEDESSEAEQSAIVDQVLGEIGIELGAAVRCCCRVADRRRRRRPRLLRRCKWTRTWRSG